IAMEPAAPGTKGVDRAEELQRAQAEFLKAQTALHSVQVKKLNAELRHLLGGDRNTAVSNLRQRLKLVLDAGLVLFGLALKGFGGEGILPSSPTRRLIV